MQFGSRLILQAHIGPIICWACLCLGLGSRATAEQRLGRTQIAAQQFLAIDASATLARGEVRISGRYALGSQFLVGQPTGHLFGEVHVRAGLLDADRSSAPYGLDLFISLSPDAVDFANGSFPMMTFGARAQFVTNQGWRPDVSLGLSATLANRYRSAAVLTPSLSWCFGRVPKWWFRLTLGGQLGLAVNPSPNQTTLGPFLLADFFTAAAVGLWRIEIIAEYGGSFVVGYFATGARVNLWNGLSLAGGVRLNIVSDVLEDTSVHPFGAITWRF